SMHDSEGPTTF
nr:immunoglobulin light chain junction region [Macaca mulatta]